jgi:hypothetical protein
MILVTQAKSALLQQEFVPEESQSKKPKQA